MGYPPRAVAFTILGIVCALALYGSAFVFGAETWRPTRIVHYPDTCAGTRFTRCLAEAVAAQAGGVVPEVLCAKVPGRFLYYCDTTVAGTCYDVLAYRASEGLPLIQTVSERTTC